MPLPSGNCSSRRMGNGFQISKTRKSIKPARKVFQASGTAMSVTSCPATSSMTTNCGSFEAEARATAVAAGIPMRVTAATAMIVAQVRLAAGICELARAHTITVASDPQVPGPGFRRPVPKKVATNVAHRGRGGETPPRQPAGRRRYGRCQARPRGCFSLRIFRIRPTVGDFFFGVGDGR